MQNSKTFITVCIAGVLLISCRKTTVSWDGDPGCVSEIKLTPSDSIPFGGDTIYIYANHPGLLYNWSGPNNQQYGVLGNDNYITIDNIKINQSGWYSCGASVPGCNPHSDSVYIRVQYPQGKPACTLTNNLITNTAGLPDVNATYVRKGYDAAEGSIKVSVGGGYGYPEYYFTFNSYNGNVEPKDGVYYTKSIDVFDGQDDANAIAMSATYFYDFNSEDNQKIYVSHVNGKLRIAFCGIRADGYGLSGLFSGQVTEQ